MLDNLLSRCDVDLKRDSCTWDSCTCQNTFFREKDPHGCDVVNRVGHIRDNFNLSLARGAVM